MFTRTTMMLTTGLFGVLLASTTLAVETNTAVEPATLSANAPVGGIAAKAAVREQWQAPTPEQKEAVKETIKERSHSASTEQKEKIRGRLRVRRQQPTQS